jgi:hypothetical protein
VCNKDLWKRTRRGGWEKNKWRIERRIERRICRKSKWTRELS